IEKHDLDKKAHGVFKLNAWLKHLKRSGISGSPSVILMSDLNHRLNHRLLKGLNKRLYVFYEDEKVIDHYIKKISLDRKANGQYLVKVNVIRTAEKPEKVILTLSHNNKALVSRPFTLNRKDNWLYVFLNTPFIDHQVLRATIKSPEKEGNIDNNHFFFRVKGRSDSKIVHIVFGRPSFDLSFLRNFLRRQEKYEVRVYIPKPGQPIRLPWLNPKDKLVLADIDKLSNPQETRIIQFVRSGGLLVFMRGDSDLPTLLYPRLASVMPFQYQRDLFQQPESMDASKTSLSLTVAGLKFAFLNFRDPDSAGKVWDELAVFPVIKGNILSKYGALVLGRMNHKPAILYQKYGRGQTVAVLFDQLWKMDFGNKGFGIQSSYYDQFWDEILKLNDPGEGPRLVSLLQEVYQYGDKAKIYVSRKDLLGDDRLEIRGTDKLERHEITLRPVNGDSGGSISVKCRYLGENRIVLIRKGRPDLVVARFYVNYPLDESVQRTNAYRKKLAQILTESTGGRILLSHDLSRLRAEDIHLRKVTERVVSETKLAHRWFTLIFIVSLMTFEWVLRRYYLGG
ncbi:MAG: hypothetical protein OEZ36_04815, partial [Spirochaetota bacterium]|nr:hypothetical protein [Spirochaetota bacterium]